MERLKIHPDLDPLKILLIWVGIVTIPPLLRLLSRLRFDLREIKREFNSWNFNTDSVARTRDGWKRDGIILEREGRSRGNVNLLLTKSVHLESRSEPFVSPLFVPSTPPSLSLSLSAPHKYRMLVPAVKHKDDSFQFDEKSKDSAVSGTVFLRLTFFFFHFFFLSFFFPSLLSSSQRVKRSSPGNRVEYSREWPSSEFLNGSLSF